MSQPSTISLERPTPKIATITFSNPPVNLIVGQTVTRLHELVAELGDDPGIQVVVFKSGVPDFFVNHFDLAAAADFPVSEGSEAVPVWTDVVLRLTKAPYITIASIRGRTRAPPARRCDGEETGCRIRRHRCPITVRSGSPAR